MSQDTVKGRQESFPGFASIVLLGTFGLLLVMLLVNSGVTTVVKPTATPVATSAVVIAAPTQMAVTAAPAAAAPAFDMDKVAAGQKVLQTTCFACHGMDAKGIPGLGKNLIESPFVHGLSDQELVAFIIKGRAATDAGNTTGIAMPPRGGNPAITDQQIEDVVTYIRYQTAKANGGLSAAPAAPAKPTTPPPTIAAGATEESGALPIDSILHPAGEATAVVTEDTFQLPINSFLTPSGEQATTPAPTDVPTLVPTTAPATAAPNSVAPTATDEPLPIDSFLTPSGS